jgi:PD-(D/E)XK nuclease superfamily
MSPSLAETMRICQLRAGLSRSAGCESYVLGNPKAWLGTAYHEVLEKVASAGTNDDINAAADRLWHGAVAAQYQRSLAHPLDRRFGSPERWPGYHLIRASVLLRARELTAADRTRFGANASAHDGTFRERRFAALGGKLVGKPDVIRQQEIIDYKSGAILEYDETSQSEVIKTAYVRQLRIYGFLVKEVLGRWPVHGVLLPFAGPGLEVPLDPDECRRAATEAVALLNEYNAKVTAGATPHQLANPSPATCKWCSFKLVCAPFWSSVDPNWSGQLDAAVVEGILREPPRTVQGGAAASLAIDVHRGSEGQGNLQLAPLNPTIHTAVLAVTSGDRVRLVGLRARADGSLVPT